MLLIMKFIMCEHLFLALLWLECVYREGGWTVYTQSKEVLYFVGWWNMLALFVVPIMFLLERTLPRAQLLAVDASYIFNEPNSIVHVLVQYMCMYIQSMEVEIYTCIIWCLTHLTRSLNYIYRYHILCITTGDWRQHTVCCNLPTNCY